MVKQTKESIIPLGDKVLILPQEREKKTSSGIVLPTAMKKERPQGGVVIATGPGRIDDKGNRVPVSVTAGDYVIFARYGGEECVYDGKEYLIVREDQISAIIK